MRLSTRLHAYMDQRFDRSRAINQSMRGEETAVVSSPRALEYNPPSQLEHPPESVAPAVTASFILQRTCAPASCYGRGDCKAWVRSFPQSALTLSSMARKRVGCHPGSIPTEHTFLCSLSPPCLCC